MSVEKQACTSRAIGTELREVSYRWHAEMFNKMDLLPTFSTYGAI
jgi:hypothetical protein